MEVRGLPVSSLSICTPIMDKFFNPSHIPVVLDINPVLYKSLLSRRNDSERTESASSPVGHQYI
jgi:hypothetical protein